MQPRWRDWANDAGLNSDCSSMRPTAPTPYRAGLRTNRVCVSSRDCRGPGEHSGIGDDDRSNADVAISRSRARESRLAGITARATHRHLSILLEAHIKAWKRSLVASALAVPSACMQRPAVAQAQSARDVQAQCIADWTVVDRDTLPDVLVANAQVARWRGKTVAVGDPAFLWRGESGQQPKSGDLVGGVVWDSAGSRKLLDPFAKRIIMYPRPATTRDGILHIVFGTRTDMTNRDWASSPDTLWHVTYDGNRWSVPEALPRSASGPYWWENISPSALVASGNELDIAIPVKSRDDSVIALLHRDSVGHWNLHHLATGGAVATYVRLSRLGSVALLSWSGADPSTAVSDRNSVFSARSFDNGITWTRPMRLHLSGLRGTYDHNLLLDATGHGFLLWTQQNPDRARPPDTLGVSMTSDTGRTWRAGPALAVPEGFGTFEAGLSAWGPVAIFQPTLSSASRMAVLKDNRWIEQELRPGLIPTSGVPALSLSPTSIAFVSAVGAEQRAGSKKTQASIATRLFVLTLHCSP